MGLMLTGCAERQDSRQGASLAPEPSSRCPGIYVLAPADYMRYMDETEPVMLSSEGREEDLPVYCTREDAVAALERMTGAGDLSPGLWVTYQLTGVWEQDVVETGPGDCRMRRPAELGATPERLTALAREPETGQNSTIR